MGDKPGSVGSRAGRGKRLGKACGCSSSAGVGGGVGTSTTRPVIWLRMSHGSSSLGRLQRLHLRVHRRDAIGQIAIQIALATLTGTQCVLQFLDLTLERTLLGLCAIQCALYFQKRTGLPLQHLDA